ncbi:MAG: hypothetical protein QM768_21830 [Agriterribacter sp.]
MTADIYVGDYKPFTPNSVTWKRSIDQYSDSSLIKIPAVAMLKSGDNYTRVQTGLQFKEGMPVDVFCGYDGNNIKRFSGFVSRINYTIPLQLECEGYSYQLRKKMGLNISHGSGVMLKTILNEIIAGTDIKLSYRIIDFKINSPVIMRNVSGTQALDWLKDRLAQTVYFNYDELYVGLRQIEVKEDVKFRLGWNTVKDDDLKFAIDREHTEVRFQMQSRNKNGSYTKEVYDSKYSNTAVKRLYVRIEDSYMKKMVEDAKATLLNRGYEGSFTAFARPYVEPGMSVTIDDQKYKERAGSYIVNEVSGSFGESGGRQAIKIGSRLND